ncbi:transcriptional regulator, GntR family [Beutenbergia cavernae DSM 12333]|uniref:Transcriptional regulator, GntR family n=1 Tax=Beutenbergia cavernae (strain ATCC BAA-8 / DSM 12333 / CCUG 43141 / JCM 11478 / NBRC 16432 / NCIMB 13614 / HKI 0122) TaxID=471853 RepID=C5BYM7_BEUC1|nr:GntR family transcriptional regulator [Beutenbergia cavernae]ACQ78985.1 transcriptional regulator, GntR family [Beutenbergia cavernae DSM 12333]
MDAQHAPEAEAVADRGEYVPHVEIDRAVDAPLYEQVAAAISDAIHAGDVAVGTRLENEVAMARRLGISRPTARRALAELVEDGLLVRRRGAGTHVASGRIARPVELTSLWDDLDAEHRTPETRVLAYDVVRDDDLCRTLALPRGTAVAVLRRLRLADGDPLALLLNHVPADLAPPREELERDGLYAALRRRGVRLHTARQRIGARLAHAEEARLLGEPGRTCVLTMERTAYDDGGRVVEHGSHAYRASRYSFSTTLLAR